MGPVLWKNHGQKAHATPDGGYIMGGSYSSTIPENSAEPMRLSNYWVIKMAADGTRQWERTDGGNRNDHFSEVIVTADGGYLVGGQSKSNVGGTKTTADFARELSKTGDFWIVKLSADGTKQWDKSYGGTTTDGLTSMIQTADGRYMLAGNSSSGISGNKSQRAKGGGDYWIVKITADGTKQWDRTFGGEQADDLTSIKQTGDGGYILAGTSSSLAGADKSEPSRGFTDYWLVKISADGSKEWDKTYGGNSRDICTSLVITPDGGYLLGGTSDSGKSGEKSENKVGGTNGGYDYWVVKVSADGTMQWDQTIGGSGIEGMTSLVVTPDNGYILGGYSLSGRSGDKTEANKGEADFWLVKLSGKGAKIWDKTIGTTEGEGLGSICPAADGGYLLAGATANPWLDGDKLTSVIAPDRRSGAWVLKWTPEQGRKLNFSADTLYFETIQDAPLAPSQTATLTASEGNPDVMISKGLFSEWLALPAPALGPVSIGLVENEISWGFQDRTFVVAWAPGYERAVMNVKLNARPPSAMLELSVSGDRSGKVDQLLQIFVKGKADPGQTVTYSLVNPPFGAAIDPASGLFEWIPNQPGVYNFHVKATTSGPPVLSKEVPVSLAISERVGFETIRINAAGPSLTTADGRSFIADAYFTGDRVSTVPEGDIANTDDDDLYRTGRCAPLINYNIPVRNGNFQVVLHFAETWFGAPGRGPAGVGKRRLNVDIQGERKLTNYDIYARAGGAMRAIQETFPVTIFNNLLNIKLSSGTADMPRIAAMEVIMVDRLARVTEPLIADTYVHDGIFADTNFGSALEMNVKTGTGSDISRNAYLKFGLFDVAEVTKAELEICGENLENFIRFVPLSVFGVTDDDWTEGGITWNNAPVPSGEPIGSVTIRSDVGPYGYYKMDVTDFVRSELAGDRIATFVLKDVEGANQKLFFTTKEAGIPKSRLVIYTKSLYPSNARVDQQKWILPTDFESPGTAVYPNPASQTFTLEVSKKHDSNVSAELVNMAGKRWNLNLPASMHPGSKTEINLAPLQIVPGMYLINVRSDVFTETHKLVIMR